ncbi:MAG TPA: hypothetical protein PKY30_02900, partial [Myxococcota bacterium]|nr:hypothetical protein [Myxococcota bacterium]
MENKPSCPLCNNPASRVTRHGYARRGERTVEVDLATWQCDAGCKNEAGTEPLRWIDRELGRENDAAIAVIWQETYGEPIPTPQRPGRKAPERREFPVHVMLTASELRALD